MAAPFEWNTSHPLVMGILNVTPDSFSDGGQFFDLHQAVEHAWSMARAGADIVDIGGESTRPGSTLIGPDEELQRVVPVIERLAVGREGQPFPAVISIDTTKAVVAQHALLAGARIVNDISALRQDPAMIEMIREAQAGLILMHMQGTPETMQAAPRYDDVVREVHDFLADRIAWAVSRGVKKSQIAVDPGIGFGKSTEHNLQLLARLEQFAALGCPILVGASRKNFIGRLLNQEPSGRLFGSLAVAAWAILHDAKIVRVHDVAETADVVRMIAAVRQAG